MGDACLATCSHDTSTLNHFEHVEGTRCNVLRIYPAGTHHSLDVLWMFGSYVE